MDEQQLRQYIDAKRPPFDLEQVYRFFTEPRYADALVAGTIRISTLQACRAYEDPMRGDPEEGTHHYNSGFASGSVLDEKFVKVANRLGIGFGRPPGEPPPDNVAATSFGTLIDCAATHRLRDAFVICTTERFNPAKLSQSFGQYCVKIRNPGQFFYLVGASLARVHKLETGMFGRVEYKPSVFTGLQSPPGLLGMVKNPDQYKDQMEVRFLWEVLDASDIAPFNLYVPGTVGMCERASCSTSPFV